MRTAMKRSISKKSWSARRAGHALADGKSPAQVALRWLIENETVLLIPGAKSGRQAADNARVLTFGLTPEEIEAVNQATLAWE